LTLPLPPSPLRVGLVGAGNVGTAVAQLLREAGHEVVGVASRSVGSADKASARLDAPAFPVEDLPGADVILLGTPEAALGEVVERLGDVRGAVLVHFAGVVGIGPLNEAQGASALCALHPVQSCPDVDVTVTRLPGSAWGVTCTDGARGWARRLIVEDLRGLPIDVREEDRALWHAAAVTTSNGISALIALAESALISLGIDDPQRVLGPIAAATVANARDRSGATTLTGPVVRAEEDVVARHIAAVESQTPEILPAYLDTIRMILRSARHAGRIDEKDALAMERVIRR
jgi:predicted short-subunit dehydrogenase-like oxidoreductase (DUF2520 family)